MKFFCNMTFLNTWIRIELKILNTPDRFPEILPLSGTLEVYFFCGYSYLMDTLHLAIWEAHTVLAFQKGNQDLGFE